MTRLLITAAALALLTTTAHADNRTAKVLGLTAVYDKQCQPIPNFKAMASTILADLPADEALTGLKQANDVFSMMGSAKFCATYKPIVDNALAAAMAGLH